LESEATTNRAPFYGVTVTCDAALKFSFPSHRAITVALPSRLATTIPESAWTTATMVSVLDHATPHTSRHATPVSVALNTPVASIASDIDVGEIEIPLTPKFGGTGSTGGEMSRSQLAIRIAALMSALRPACMSSGGSDYLGDLSSPTGVTRAIASTFRCVGKLCPFVCGSAGRLR